MNITRGLPSAPLASFPVLTIGNFDGQHLGHRALIEAVVENARRLKGVPNGLVFRSPSHRSIATWDRSKIFI